MKTTNQIKKYEAEIDIIKKKIVRLQNRCKHKNIDKIPKSNTGNYLDPDIYWYEITCKDCSKFWTEDQ
jgi:hypothetical protein